LSYASPLIELRLTPIELRLTPNCSTVGAKSIARAKSIALGPFATNCRRLE